MDHTSTESPERSVARRLLTGVAAAALMLGAGATPDAAGTPPHGGHLGVAPGKIHPDLWLPDTAGRVRKLSDFSGHKLLVFHFASW